MNIVDNQRIEFIIKVLNSKGIKFIQSEISKVFDINKGITSRMFNGKIGVPDEFFNQFKKHYKVEKEAENFFVTLNKITKSPKENVKVINDVVALTIGKQSRMSQNISSSEGWDGVPMYNVPVSASFVQHYHDMEFEQPQFYLRDPRFKDCNFGAVVTGDSMHGEIRHSDRVICKELSNKRSIVHGDIYYIVTDELETCKYIHPVIKDIRTGAIRRKDGSYSHNDIIYDDDKFLLVPHNNSVPASEIYKEDIIKLYKVKGVLRGY